MMKKQMFPLNDITGNFAGAVIVHNTGGFVGKSSETEDAGNQVVIYVIDYVKVGFGV